ncbi:MAG: M20/M25/M40 family metallo-hydrolase [Pleurocapsa minor GSE-CHR-MK-17-07R]|jgi:hypothetical protein|nr:M20/M25/M40 family metallo-hydrolase [Pleurocapsa minor GSE-CHR-MK 17-07R]
MKNHHSLTRLFYPAGAMLAIVLVSLACNLSSETRPPTIIPRASATPPPTIGYPTLQPDELPQEATLTAPNRDEMVLLNTLNQVEADRLFIHVNTLQGFGSRHVNSPYGNPSFGIGAAADYVQRQFEQIRVESQGRFAVLQPQQFSVEYEGVSSVGRNIIGVLAGRETGAGVILIGAHYDSISVDRQNSAASAPGANDNATGTAALIEIARIMSQYTPRSTIMFVAFGVEEINRRGSIAFVEEYLKPNGIVIDAMLNMDIIGSSTGPNGATIDDQIRLFSAEPNTSGSRQLARSINLITSRHVPMMSVSVEATGDREGRYSDHLSFSDGGFPAVRFIEYLEDPTRQHTDRDVIDAIRPSYLVRATQTVLASAMALADGPRAPRSISLRPNDSGTRTLVWETTLDATSYVVALRQPGSLVYNYYFDVNSNTVTWDGFTPDRWEAISIAARDSAGLMGPLSNEFFITN